MQRENKDLKEYLMTQAHKENALSETISKLSTQMDAQKKIYSEASEDLQRRLK
jgi:hypothetical protein